jgi:hypothetical protein
MYTRRQPRLLLCNGNHQLENMKGNETDLAKGLENLAALQHKSVEQLALEGLRSVCEPTGSPRPF